MPTLNKSPSLVRADHTLTATTTPHAPGVSVALNFNGNSRFAHDRKAHAAINYSPTDGHTMTGHTIPLPDVELALMSAKLRQRTKGGTALLAAYTARPLLEIDCHRGAPRTSTLALAASSGVLASEVTLVDRGHIAALFERIRLHRGLAEVRRTFGCGIKALRAEPKWSLFCGSKANVGGSANGS